MDQNGAVRFFWPSFYEKIIKGGFLMATGCIEWICLMSTWDLNTFIAREVKGILPNLGNKKITVRLFFEPPRFRKKRGCFSIFNKERKHQFFVFVYYIYS